MTDDADVKGERDPVAIGSQAAGAIAGVGLTVIAGPLAGAAGGVAVEHTVKRVAREISERVLAPRQERRVLEALEGITSGSSLLLDAGERPRDDGFFEPRADGPSDADELLEGTLLHAANSYEQRKVPYIANLFTSVAFTEGEEAAYAQFLLHLADRLTWRQMVMIAVFAAPPVEQLRRLDRRREEGTLGRRPFDIAQIDALGNLGIIGVGSPDGETMPRASVSGSSFMSIAYARMAPLTQGWVLYRLLKLDQIPATDREALVEGLRV